MTLTSDAKFKRKLILGLKNDMRNLETPLQSSTPAKKKAKKERIQPSPPVAVFDQNGAALELKFKNKDKSSRKNNACREDFDKRLDSRRLQTSEMICSQFKLKKCADNKNHCCLKRPTLASSQ